MSTLNTLVNLPPQRHFTTSIMSILPSRWLLFHSLHNPIHFCTFLLIDYKYSFFWYSARFVETGGIGHEYFVCRRKQNLSTPARLFFVLKKHGSAFRFPTQLKQFSCSVPTNKICPFQGYFVFVETGGIEPPCIKGLKIFLHSIVCFSANADLIYIL